MLKPVGSVFQITCFSQYNVLENAVAKSLEDISKPENQYLLNYAKDMIAKRNLLVRVLVDSDFDFDVWVPKGSHFVIADISRIEIDPKYRVDSEGRPRTKDYAFAYQLAHENGIICIPCSPFYDQSNTEAQNYVRFAFCNS